MSGKTTIANLIESTHKIPRTKSFTNRPMRKGEIDGVDYIFYDHDTVLLLSALGRVSAMRAYQPHSDFGILPWYYGFITSDIVNSHTSFLITDNGGIKDLKEKFGSENVVVFYLNISDEDQMARLNDRGSDLMEEQLRRIKKDKLEFADAKNNADHIISATKKPAIIAKEIAKIIEKIS